MSDSFNRAKSKIGQSIAIGGLGLAIAWGLAGWILPAALVGVVRFGLVIAFLAGVTYMAFRMGGGVLKKRRAEVQALAQEAGYTFEPVVGVSDGAEFLKDLNHFALFSHERGVLGKRPDATADAKAAKVMDMLGNLDVTNRITGTAGRYRFQAFDFRYSAHQETKMAQRTTAFLVTLEGADVPSIRMIPRASAGVIGSLFAKLGGSEIRLLDHPNFEQRFILRGSDQPAVEALFTPNLVTTLVQLGDEIDSLTVEAAGDQLLLYRFDRLAEHGQFDAMRSAGTRIAEALTAS